MIIFPTLKQAVNVKISSQIVFIYYKVEHVWMQMNWRSKTEYRYSILSLFKIVKLQ